jgi:DNA-binding Lrp family transcriptional regulator
VFPHPGQAEEGEKLNLDPEQGKIMDSLDKKLLDIIQSGFPLEERPYAAIGQELGLDEDQVLERVRRLKADGVIRRIGANFQSKKLGWHSTLCAASVPRKRLEEFREAVNRRPGVTHNYLRAHRYNVWFTFIGPSREAVAESLAEISRETGVDILNLPQERLFKIKVDFRMKDKPQNQGE